MSARGAQDQSREDTKYVAMYYILRNKANTVLAGGPTVLGQECASEVARLSG